MSEEIVFYHSPMSRGRVVHWMLEEIGAPYRHELLSFDKGEHKSAAYLAINPMGKVPAIVHKDVVITEVPAILAYLADEFPARHLAPAIGDAKRGSYLRWMFFGHGCLEVAIVDRMLARPAPERASALGYGTYDNAMAAIEQALTPGPFLLGDSFSAADILVGSALGWGLMMKAVEPRPAFMAYLERGRTRPAFARFNAQSAALLEEMKAKA